MKDVNRLVRHKDIIDRKIERVIRRQKGVITRNQLLEIGLSGRAIGRRLEWGELVPVLPRTYAALVVPTSWQQRVIAALLWAGEGATASHRAAARLWQLLDLKEDLVEITVCRALRSPVPWMTVHRSSIDGDDVRRLEGVSATSVDRTLLDLGSVVPPLELEEALESAFRRGLTDIDRLNAYVASRGGMGKRGSRSLTRLLQDRGEQPATESRFETEFLALLRKAGLPPPSRQFIVSHEGEVIGRFDFAYPQARVVIETDGWKFHSGRAVWRRDLAKGNDLLALGWRLLRFTYEDLKQRPAWVIDRIRRALGLTLF